MQFSLVVPILINKFRSLTNCPVVYSVIIHRNNIENITASCQLVDRQLQYLFISKVEGHLFFKRLIFRSIIAVLGSARWLVLDNFI